MVVAEEGALQLSAVVIVQRARRVQLSTLRSSCGDQLLLVSFSVSVLALSDLLLYCTRASKLFSGDGDRV